MIADRAGDAARQNRDLTDALLAQAAETREMVRLYLVEISNVRSEGARIRADDDKGAQPDGA